MIACLTIPYFATAIERRADQTLAAAQLVLGGRPWEPRPVYAFSREVAYQGARPGMSLRLVHVLAPQARFMPAAQECYLDAAGEVTDVLADFTPLLEPEALWLPAAGSSTSRPVVAGAAPGRSLPARYTLDLEGLPLVEALPLVQEMGRTVRRQAGLSAAVGLAGGRFTAQVAAALTRPNHARPVPPGEEAGFLADRPLAFLPLERETARRLRLLGIRTLGQLADLPPSAIRESFGPDLARWQALAAGRISLREPAVRPSPAARSQRLVHHFAEPVADRLVLANVLDRLVRELSGRLTAVGQAAGRLSLALQPEGTEKWREQNCLLRRSAANPRLLAARFDALLETLLKVGPASPIGSVSALAVTAGGLEPAVPTQLSLFAVSNPTSLGKMALLAGRVAGVAARHDTAAFYRPEVIAGGHLLPECRFQLQPWTVAAG